MVSCAVRVANACVIAYFLLTVLLSAVSEGVTSITTQALSNRLEVIPKESARSDRAMDCPQTRARTRDK